MTGIRHGLEKALAKMTGVHQIHFQQDVMLRCLDILEHFRKKSRTINEESKAIVVLPGKTVFVVSILHGQMINGSCSGVMAFPVFD